MGRQKRDFNYCKVWLRRKFPSKYPSFVRCVSQDTIYKHSNLLEKNFGIPNNEGKLEGVCFTLYYDNNVDSFTILLDKALNNKEKIACLLHEWAHLLRAHIPDKLEYSVHDSVWISIHNRLKKAWHSK